jgi:hypothetical protein
LTDDNPAAAAVKADAADGKDAEKTASSLVLDLVDTDETFRDESGNTYISVAKGQTKQTFALEQKEIRAFLAQCRFSKGRDRFWRFFSKPFPPLS